MATIEARITKVEHDLASGWYSIHTDHGSVKKLTTKMDPKAKEAADLRQSGEVVVIQYSHKQRHDESSGRTYDNYYYERAATTNGGSAGRDDSSGIDQIQPNAPGSSTLSRRTDPTDAWRMTLAASAKLAIMTLPLLKVEERSPEDQWQLTLWWARRLYQTPPPTQTDGGFGATPSGPAPGTYDEPFGYESAPPPGDDDIPF